MLVSETKTKLKAVSYSRKDMLFFQTKNRKYIVTCKGNIISVDSTGKKRQLTPVKGRVRINNRLINVIDIIAHSYFRELFEDYKPRAYKIYFSNGKSKDIKLKNLILIMNKETQQQI